MLETQRQKGEQMLSFNEDSDKEDLVDDPLDVDQPLQPGSQQSLQQRPPSPRQHCWSWQWLSLQQMQMDFFTRQVSRKARDCQPKDKFSKGDSISYKSMMHRFDLAVGEPGIDARSKLTALAEWPSIEDCQVLCHLSRCRSWIRIGKDSKPCLGPPQIC